MKDKIKFKRDKKAYHALSYSKQGDGDEGNVDTYTVSRQDKTMEDSMRSV
jgi:hypothetical protein